MTIKRAILKVDGSVIPFEKSMSIFAVYRTLGAKSVDSISLHHMGYPLHVMMIDDQGHLKGLPVNAQATALYHLNCKPDTTHEIRGDAIIVPDSDFSEVPHD